MKPLYVKTLRSGDLDDRLASANIGHDPLVDLAGEDALQAPDHFACGPAVRGAAHDGVDGQPMVSHADDNGTIKGDVGLVVTDRGDIGR